MIQKGYLKKGSGWDDLYDWSVREIAEFWSEYLEFGEFLLHKKPDTILKRGERFIDSQWFVGAEVNFAQNLLRHRNDQTAIVSYIEGELHSRISYNELYDRVCVLQQALKEAGVQFGDRVCAVMPNVPETIIAMLAVTALGAIWASCSPDFGVQAILDRFGQIEPVVLFAIDGVRYKGKTIDCTAKITQIVEQLGSVRQCVLVASGLVKPDLSRNSRFIEWTAFQEGFGVKPQIDFVHYGFDHPVYIMFSSGTTGLPKCIVQGAGVLLNHNKEHRLHCDISSESRVFFFTTCGWMMWNWLVSVLHTNACVVLYDGNPIHPDECVLWKIAQDEKIDIFGCSPKYLALLQDAGFRGASFDLSFLKAILTTGAPMTPGLFGYVYKHIINEVQLSSISGGTDLNGCFGLGNPLLPVYSGEIQCRGLGMAVEIYDDGARSVWEQQGELVCTQPFPSMPLYFWKDPLNVRYLEAYFEQDEQIWYHGDYALLSKKGGLIIYGRSDATLNPGGVRIGTADIYNQLDFINEIEDSIIIAQPWHDDVRIVLFVKLVEGLKLSNELVQKIKTHIRQHLSPRHVPELVLEVTGIPYTHNGKKVELAVKKTVMGLEVKNTGALANPDILAQYNQFSELQK